MGKSTTYDEHQSHRFKQEVVLGIVGVRFLEKLGYNIRKHHMNEGHTALATLEIANKNGWDEEKTKKKFSFTTHTLVPAGHEIFPMGMVESILKDSFPLDKIKEYGEEANCLNMTKLAMSLSDYQNGVSKKMLKLPEKCFLIII